MIPAAAQRRLDRANPVLIKDLRQFLRGRLFRGAFVLTLIVATIVASVILAEIDSWNRNQSGRDLFFGLSAAYTVAVFLVGPVLANRGMAAEREQHLLDALALTSLTPARIVAGKFAAAAVLTLLIFSAFLPGFAAAFSLFGVDTVLAGCILLLTTLAGCCLNMLGIWAACLARTALAGNLLLGLLLIALGGSCAAWIAASAALAFGLGGGGGALVQFLIGMLLTGALILGLCYWLYALSAWLLAHVAQPAIGRVRVAVVALTGAALLIAAFSLWDNHWPGPLHFAVSSLYAFATFLMLPNLCEPDVLDPRTRRELRRTEGRRSMMFLPGGGAATALWLTLLGGVTLLYLMPAGSRGGSWDTHGAQLPLGMLLLCLAAGTWLPARAGRAGAARPRWVFLAYAGVPIVAVAHVILAGIFGVVDSDAVGSLNPFGLLVLASDGRAGAGLVLWLIVGGAGLALAVRRIVGAVRQIRRARDAESPA